ncbi:MAG: RluA family pseudouridine synthase [Lactobacillales bacterium]|jgi:23S rRNA pseudouridine1911/1915/1917 synthase|nr:RluA family pseudouridine synthase [Lactobacillales bacterium]
MKITVKEAGRADKILASQIADYSRSIISSWLKDGLVTANGAIIKPNHKVKIGDIIEIEIPEIKETHLIAQDIPLDIVYEDDDVAVVYKPQGMVVHPSAGHGDGTLVNALLFHLKNLSGINGEYRPGIVHRIDKDTSGLLMVAKNDKAHENLSEQLRAKTTKREYIALVHGEIEPNKGEIIAPIGRDPKHRQRQAIVGNGRDAVTHFEVMERFDGFSLAKCILETGRTHQIRIHMKYIEHPLAGDPLYGPRNTIEPNAGQFLHAKTLGFKHPTTDEWMEFDSELPVLFIETIKNLRGEI